MELFISTCFQGATSLITSYAGSGVSNVWQSFSCVLSRVWVNSTGDILSLNSRYTFVGLSYMVTLLMVVQIVRRCEALSTVLAVISKLFVFCLDLTSKIICGFELVLTLGLGLGLLGPWGPFKYATLRERDRERDRETERERERERPFWTFSSLNLF